MYGSSKLCDDCGTTRIGMRVFAPEAFVFGQVVRIQCPYCFEVVEVALEPDVEGEMIFDCEVCCRPWLVVVSWRGDLPDVRVSRAQ